MKHLIKICFTFAFILVLMICNVSNAGTAKVSASVKTDFGSSTKLTVCLQKYNVSKDKWTTIKTWTKNSTHATTILESTYKLSSKGKYRAKMKAASIKVKSEKIEKKSDKNQILSCVGAVLYAKRPLLKGKNGWRAKVGTYKYGKVEAATKSKYDKPKKEQKIKVTNMVNGKSSIFRK